MTSGFSFKRSGLTTLAGWSERKQPVNEHFEDFNKLPETGTGAQRSWAWEPIAASHRGVQAVGWQLKDGERQKLEFEGQEQTKPATAGSALGGLLSQAVRIESESLHFVVMPLRPQHLPIEGDVQRTHIARLDHELVMSLDRFLRRSRECVLADLLTIRGDADPRILARFDQHQEDSGIRSGGNRHRGSLGNGGFRRRRRSGRVGCFQRGGLGWLCPGCLGGWGRSLRRGRGRGG